MAKRPPSIAIIGAGIGGLVAAACLRRIGIDVRIYEQAGGFTRLGAGIQQAPNAIRVLYRCRHRRRRGAFGGPRVHAGQRTTALHRPRCLPHGFPDRAGVACSPTLVSNGEGLTGTLSATSSIPGATNYTLSPARRSRRSTSIPGPPRGISRLCGPRTTHSIRGSGQFWPPVRKCINGCWWNAIRCRPGSRATWPCWGTPVTR